MHHCEPDSYPSNGCRESSTGRLHLDLLGTFRLWQDNQPVDNFEYARFQHLLAYLALHRTTPIQRQQIAFLFWPDSTDQQALKNLRTLLTRLRHAFPDADHFIQVTAQTIQWRPDMSLTLDAAEFETALALAAAAQKAGDYPETAKSLAAAVDAYTGDLLPGCFDDWILPLREQFHQACRDALERLVLLLEEHREYSSALPYARRLLNHDPLRESAYHHLIRLHLALGDRTEALRACRACETMLEREFGASLTRATRDLYERLLKTEDQPVLESVDHLLESHSSNLPLVGRDVEWSRLIAAWRAAAAGHPQTVLISGEAGIGKTRLAEELCAWVARQGADVAVAHCYPVGGAAVAYAPVVEWLRDKGLQSRLAALDDVWLVEITRIFPTLLTSHPHLKSPDPLTETWQRTRIFEALARAVLGPDERAPLLLFLDDLQWCDQETLDWLGYLLRFASKAPLLIVAAVRKYEIDRVHPLMAFWFALTRSGLLSEIPLAPFNAAETGRLAAHVAGRAVEAVEAAQIYHDTEGNPLFVVEIVRASKAGEEADRNRSQGIGDPARDTSREDVKHLPASFPVPSTPAAFPPKVRAVIQWRLAQLSPVAQALAQTAAVIGRKFSFEILAQASGQDEKTVVEGLEELWQRHLVRAQGGALYDFTHDGIRAVAYDDIGLIHRRAAHLRVAQALEQIHHDDLDAFSIQIAGHCEQAGQIKPAITFYRRAASVAQNVYANAAAARLYQHLLESELSAELSRSEKCAVMLALAEVWRATGHWAQAERISRKALAEATALGDIRFVARARRALADVLHLLGYYDAALQWLAEAEQGFQAAGDLCGAAGTLRVVGQIHWLRGDHAQALASLERQLEIATEINDPRGICEALEAIGMVLWSQGEWMQAADNCLKAILIAGPLEYKPILTRASITLGNIRSGEHRYGEAVYWYQRAGTLARVIDDRQALSWAIYRIALILAKRGDDERACAGFEHSLQTAWEIGDRWTTCINLAGLAVVTEHQGRVDEAETLYRQSIDFGLRLSIRGYLSDMLLRLARFLLAQGRADEARSTYEQAFTQISGAAGECMASEDIRFDAQVLGIRLRHVMGELTGAQAAAELHALLLDEDAPTRQAALNYALWQITPEDEAAQTAAAALYRAEYAETGAEECRRQYQELTGEWLPDPPPLPDVSDLIPDQREAPGLAEILAQLKSSFQWCRYDSRPLLKRL